MKGEIKMAEYITKEQVRLINKEREMQYHLS